MPTGHSAQGATVLMGHRSQRVTVPREPLCPEVTMLTAHCAYGPLCQLATVRRGPPNPGSHHAYRSPLFPAKDDHFRAVSVLLSRCNACRIMFTHRLMLLVSMHHAWWQHCPSCTSPSPSQSSQDSVAQEM